MTNSNLTESLARVRGILERRPSYGLQPDSPATATWHSGFQVASRHPNGTSLMSDLPREFGGGGEHLTPGWFFRAGLAACTLTSILICAARQGIALSSLEILVSSASDNRGLFGVTEQDGSEVIAAPQRLFMAVKIDSTEASSEQLEALVQEGYRCSYAAQGAVLAIPLTLNVATRTS